ncbi:hypothetical protein L596_013889 [Steinernema carpocapsae]|uniref:Uncharacterized protein n=1 Tax=Steinernema carpocapsae TaxID=34508 RepID=A0A4U5P1J7_STECR|nr:hypothetical protein L596_013889 [Steinernema carpocapsae]
MSSIVFTGTDKPKDTAPVGDVHLLPCKLHYSGPANVSSYFLREKDASNPEEEYASFRGHWMHGVKFDKSNEKLDVFLMKETSSKKAQRVFAVEEKLDSFFIWHDDTINRAMHPVLRAINHIKLAEALAIESDEEDGNDTAENSS